MGRHRSSAATTGGPPKKARTQSAVPAEEAANRLLQSNNFSVLPEESGSNVVLAKKERVPPLFTSCTDLVKLESGLSQQNLRPRFKLCSVGIKIVCSNLDEYKKVGAHLTAGGVQFYTHDMPSTKPFKVVLRGLLPFSTDEVKAELLKNGLTALNVYPMTRRSIENITFRDQLFLVHFTKGTTNISALKNIKDLFRMIVSWEPYRPQHRDVTLCTNCQRFGHGTKNCHMQTRCGKCAGDHSTASCGLVDDSVLKCVNCGGDHGTSNRACPKRAEFISIRQKATTSNQPGRKRNVRTPPINSEAEYPALQHRRQVPNLAPLPLNNQRSSNFTPANSSNLTDTLRRSAQPRLAAAAAQPMQGYSSVPTLTYADVASGISSDMFTTQELLTLVSEVIIIMRTCKTQTEQLQAALSLIKKYVP